MGPTGACHSSVRASFQPCRRPRNLHFQQKFLNIYIHQINNTVDFRGETIFLNPDDGDLLCSRSVGTFNDRHVAPALECVALQVTIGEQDDLSERWYNFNIVKIINLEAWHLSAMSLFCLLNPLPCCLKGHSDGVLAHQCLHFEHNQMLDCA
jgi:hypothetical protein